MFAEWCRSKIKFKMFNIGVDFIKNCIYNPNLNSNFVSDVGDEWNLAEVITYDTKLFYKLS